jgi:hypothetical protein
MEPHAFECRPTPCAEFPNDNPGLHHGAVWACVELGRVPVCELPMPDTTRDPVDLLRTGDPDSHPLDDDEEPIEIVDDLAFDETTDEALHAGTHEALYEPPSGAAAVDSLDERTPADPFAELMAALGEVAGALGAGPDAIACLYALFGQTRLEGVAAGARAEALVTGGVLAPGARGFVRSGAFTAKVLAWQGILRGETDDFAMPDGGALEPLDEWTADVLARVLGPPARADGIRRDLRRRGVAAFGLVSQAA